jgi:hypothetical protein
MTIEELSKAIEALSEKVAIQEITLNVISEAADRLEEKLNITITKYVRGIHLFSTEEEAEQWDKESEAGSK